MNAMQAVPPDSPQDIHCIPCKAQPFWQDYSPAEMRPSMFQSVAAEKHDAFILHHVTLTLTRLLQMTWHFRVEGCLVRSARAVGTGPAHRQQYAPEAHTCTAAAIVEHHRPPSILCTIWQHDLVLLVRVLC